MSLRDDLLEAYRGEPKTVAQAVALMWEHTRKPPRFFSATPYLMTKMLIDEGLVERAGQADDVTPRWKYRLVTQPAAEADA